MKINTLFALTLLSLLSACTPVAETEIPLATPSLPAAFALTPQFAQAQAQATLSAGEALRSDLAITATALALEGKQADQRSTEVAVQVAQAAATQEVFSQQTAIAAQAKATAAAESATARANHAAATQAVAQTATHWVQTATPLAATQSAIVREVQSAERKAYWTGLLLPFRVLLEAIAFIVLLIGLIYTYRRLLRIVELRLGVISSADGEVNLLLPADEEVKLLMPGRSFGAAMHSAHAETTISGVAADSALQDRVLARHQAIRLAATLPPGRTTRQLGSLLGSEQQTTPVFRILAPTEEPPLLDGDTLDILEGEWRQADETR